MSEIDYLSGEIFELQNKLFLLEERVKKLEGAIKAASAEPTLVACPDCGGVGYHKSACKFRQPYGPPIR